MFLSGRSQSGCLVRSAAFAALLIASPSHLFGEQTYIGRFDAYGGFMYFDSPHINLAERGFHFQGGVRARTWLSLGFDFTTDTGHTSLGADLFTVSLQQQIGALLEQLAAAGKLPPGYTVSLPISSSTQTYAAGPQFAFHRWSRVTLYVRPDFGAIHETATLHPQDPIATGIVAQLAPSGKKTDWTPFYGFGGVADVNITKHFALRLNADFVHDHLFSDVLRDGRNTYRLAIGPAFQFGQNVRK